MTGEAALQATESFRITSLEDAETLGTYLSRYANSVLSGYNVCDDICNIYKYSRIHCQDDRINGKLLNACIDLELTYLFMTKNANIASGTHNQLHTKGKLASGSVLKDFELFSGKLDILDDLSTLSFRIRAFWDKYMGILFLLYEWAKYEKFIRTKSRRKYFIRHAQEWPQISPHFQNCLTNIVRTWLIHSQIREAVKEIDRLNYIFPFPDPFLRILDELIAMSDAVRTSEAHGSGYLRKWSLANLPINRSRDFTLVNHWNVTNEFMHALRMTIGDGCVQN